MIMGQCISLHIPKRFLNPCLTYIPTHLPRLLTRYLLSGFMQSITTIIRISRPMRLRRFPLIVPPVCYKLLISLGIPILLRIPVLVLKMILGITIMTLIGILLKILAMLFKSILTKILIAISISILPAIPMSIPVGTLTGILMSILTGTLMGTLAGTLMGILMGTLTGTLMGILMGILTTIHTHILRKTPAAIPIAILTDILICRPVQMANP